MESKNELLDEKLDIQESKGILEKNRICLEKDNLQYNSQDLDQEQKVDVNPVQLNTQNFHIHVKNDNNYCGINGTVYLEKTKEVVRDADIYLYFGNESKRHVYKTNSDHNGNFDIADLPPGYYTIFADHGVNLKYQSNFIKVLPCQKVNHLIHLKEKWGTGGDKHF